MADTDLQEEGSLIGTLTFSCWCLRAYFILIETPCPYSGGIILDHQTVAYTYPIVYDRVLLRSTRHSWLAAIELRTQPIFSSSLNIFKLLFFGTALLRLKLITFGEGLKEPARGSKRATQKERRGAPLGTTATNDSRNL